MGCCLSTYDKVSDAQNTESCIYDREQITVRCENERSAEWCKKENNTENSETDRNIENYQVRENTENHQKVQDEKNNQRVHELDQNLDQKELDPESNSKDHKKDDNPQTRSQQDFSKKQDTEIYPEWPNYEQFELIDDHARKAPISVQTNIRELVKYLASKAKDELELVRAFYVWICENISFDTETYHSKVSSAKRNTEDILRYKVAMCEGYAELFQTMCEEGNIKCEIWYGFGKGNSHKPGDIISYENNKTYHAWNVVLLNGTRRIIDATWGSGFIGESGTFEKQFTNFYFLTLSGDSIYV